MGEFATKQPYRRIFDLEGARVTDVRPHPTTGGWWIIDLSHRGTDDGDCTICVQQADIHFAARSLLLPDETGETE